MSWLKRPQLNNKLSDGKTRPKHKQVCQIAQKLKDKQQTSRFSFVFYYLVDQVSDFL